MHVVILFPIMIESFFIEGLVQRWIILAIIFWRSDFEDDHVCIFSAVDDFVIVLFSLNRYDVHGYLGFLEVFVKDIILSFA
jgi:hypothetical protein